MIKLKNILSEIQLNKVAKNTDSKRRNKSKQIESKLSTVLKFGMKGGHRLHFKLKANSQSIPGQKYDIDFRTPPNKPITEDNWSNLATGNLSIFSNCSCPDFKYRWEAVLFDENSARRITSNGEMPDITNPTYKKAFCKHILSAWPVVKEYIKKKDFSKIGPVRR